MGKQERFRRVEREVRRRQVRMNDNRRKGWRSRLYLPHLDLPGLVQSVTFRLADSLPSHVVAELAAGRLDAVAAERLAEEQLHAGHGACALRDPRIAQIVEDALLHFDGDRYRLLAWCVMPNHVHVVAEIGESRSLGNVMHGWKSYTAKAINRLVERSGALWQREYYDRYVRDDRHLVSVIDYVERNPVAAGLVERPEDWAWSSARRRAAQSR